MSAPASSRSTEAARWPEIVVVGGIATDCMARAPKLPAPGTTVLGDRFDESPGGKGANQALAARRLGGRVALIGRAGADARGDIALARLNGEGVDARYVVRDDSAATGVVLIQLDQEGTTQMLAVRGANDRLAVSDLEAAADLFAAPRAVLVQLEIPLPVVARALELGRDAGARVILDPAPATPLPDDVLALVDVIRPNRKEAKALTGIEVHDRDSARRAAHALLPRGVRVAAVEAGSEGNLLVWKDGEVFVPVLPVAAVEATGAGDAFAAALAVALADGGPLDDSRSLAAAARFASAAAALATTAFGAQAGLPRRADVLELLARVPAARP